MTSALRNQLTRFAAVGALATGVQYVLLAVFVELFRSDPVIASALSFSLSALANYILNHRMTFGGSSSHVRAFPRFFVVAILGLGINTSVMAAAYQLLSVHYLVAQAVATAVVFTWTFMGNRLWTFR